MIRRFLVGYVSRKSIIVSVIPCQIHTACCQPLMSWKYVHVKKNIKVKKPKVVVWHGMTVAQLAEALNKDVQQVYFAIHKVDSPLSEIRFHRNTAINDNATIQKVVNLCGASAAMKPRNKPAVERIDKDVYRRDIYATPERLKPRSPVVTIMGHVDHGKTTLLDRLRSSRIVDSEFGGITQHVGAFKVNVMSLQDVVQSNSSSKESQHSTSLTEIDEATLDTGEAGVEGVVTFIDTPGHAAFSSMRARGAQCTDIVVLVVAADDGVMPQTLESVRMAQEAGVPVVVAVSKMDRIVQSEAEVKVSDRVLTGLAKTGLVAEALGGEVQVVPISAPRGWGLVRLVEAVLALAELQELVADWDGKAGCEAVVLETIPGLAGGVGAGAVVLVRHGLLRPGSVLVAGQAWARVRTLQQPHGDLAVTPINLQVGRPSDPVLVTGWREGVLPTPGDYIVQVHKEARAREVVHYRKTLTDAERSARDREEYERLIDPYRQSYKAYLAKGVETGKRYRLQKPQLDEFMYPGDEAITPHVNVLIKADVKGSIEALQETFETVREHCSDQVVLKLASIGLGNLTDSDLEMAQSTNCIVYLFNLPHSPMPPADANPVTIKKFNVIYHLFEELRDHVQSCLPSTSELEVIGEAEILKLFEITEQRSTKVRVMGAQCVHGSMWKSGDYFYRLVSRRRPCQAATDSDGDDNGENDEEVEIATELTCKNLRHLKTDVLSVKVGTEFGVVLKDKGGNDVRGQVGDMVQCCRLQKIHQKLRWDIGF